MSKEKKKTQKRRKISIEMKKAEDFRRVYAIGAIGGHTPWDFRIGFYNDTPKIMKPKQKQNPTMDREIMTEVILSPMAAKELLLWLGTHVKQYEKQFGPINVRKPKGTDNSQAPNQSSRFPTYE